MAPLAFDVAPATDFDAAHAAACRSAAVLLPTKGAAASAVVHVDKVASSAAGCLAVHEEAYAAPGCVSLSYETEPRIGNLVAVRVTDGDASRNSLELGNGRLASLRHGDVVVGVLGNRKALKGYVGLVPEKLTSGDTLHVLNLGGVIGICGGAHQGLGRATVVEYIGTVTCDGALLNLMHGALQPSDNLAGKTPLVFVAGTCMNAGKTRVASELIGRFAQQGLRVAAGKLTGVACLRDTLLMQDLGAVRTRSFLDCGLPSTVGLDNVAPLAKAIVNDLSDASPDVIVLELGDGLLGAYGVDSLLNDQELMQACAGFVVCANDFVGAFGAIHLLAAVGLAPDVIAGPATDSAMAEEFVAKQLGVPAANAVKSGQRLFELVASKVGAHKAKQVAKPKAQVVS